MQIIPAILATNEKDYKDKLFKVSNNEFLEDGWVQIDLMDNKFVQNKSIEPKIIKKYPSSLKIEAQLMVEYPENWIDQLVTNKVDRIIFPVEDSEGTKERIAHVRNHGVEVGLSINPRTSIETLDPFVATIDVALLMSVEPGFGGQNFIADTYQKVKSLKSKGWSIKLGVDGGIEPEIARQLSKLEVDYIVVGSHLIEGDIDENLEIFWQAIKA
ncbi:ribulose-phosphate 3-epimerase [Candidatus Daviesbacteria bacterium]|nr:ribulose-phosphate 3-epimerase [Candidatus Daviesbacteria bacterium]